MAVSEGKAVVDGVLAMEMERDELQTLVKALCNGGINVVAIHNRMTHEEPQIFLHYWGTGPAELNAGSPNGGLVNFPRHQKLGHPLIQR